MKRRTFLGGALASLFAPLIPKSKLIAPSGLPLPKAPVVSPAPAGAGFYAWESVGFGVLDKRMLQMGVVDRGTPRKPPVKRERVMDKFTPRDQRAERLPYKEQSAAARWLKRNFVRTTRWKVEGDLQWSYP